MTAFCDLGSSPRTDEEEGEDDEPSQDDGEEGAEDGEVEPEEDEESDSRPVSGSRAGPNANRARVHQTGRGWMASGVIEPPGKSGLGSQILRDLARFIEILNI